MDYLIENYDNSWDNCFKSLNSELSLIDRELSKLNTIIYPPKESIFNAFKFTKLTNLKVVIIGQDPYHGVGEAMGIAFSVPAGVKIPPSLRNIFKELESDLSITPPLSGDITDWAKRGVLLINSVLTVEKDSARSHKKKIGWESFTEGTIEWISKNSQGVVFLLWGKDAQKLSSKIDISKHSIIESAHPSPLSAYRGFFGSAPFSKINNYLKEYGKSEINWSIDEK